MNSPTAGFSFEQVEARPIEILFADFQATPWSTAAKLGESQRSCYFLTAGLEPGSELIGLEALQPLP